MEEFVQSTSLITLWEIHDLIVKIVKISNENIVKFPSHDTSIHEAFNHIVYAGSNIEHASLDNAEYT